MTIKNINLNKQNTDLKKDDKESDNTKSNPNLLHIKS